MNLRRSLIATFAAACCWLAVAPPLPAEAAVPRPRQGAQQKGHHALVQNAIQRTQRILRRAAAAVAKDGKEQKEFRDAAVHQRAARRALKAGRFAVAMHLTLEAREVARGVIKANIGTVAQEDENDDPQETKLDQGIDHQEAHGYVDQASKTAADAAGCVKNVDACS